MCGGADWGEEGWKPFANLEMDLFAAATGPGIVADTALARETHELSALPGVPLS
jgi:hypothetical protein